MMGIETQQTLGLYRNCATRHICVGIGKANWQVMEQVESSGEWVGTIDTALVPNGEQLLRVITENKKVRATVVVKIENPLKRISLTRNCRRYQLGQDTAAFS